MRGIIVVLAFVGCSKSPDERAAAEFREFRDRMCACDSSDCKREVSADYDAWGKSELGKVMAQQRGAWIDDVEKEMRECRRARARSDR